MPLRFTRFIDLPAHDKGGFDHASVHTGMNRLFVAHTANNSVDVIDCLEDRYLHSIPHLTEAAGALVTEASNHVFTSNRGENTVGIFSPEDESRLTRIPVGIRPNGLAYDAYRDLLLVAHVGDPAIPDSTTVSVIKVAERELLATILVPGRTRWTIYDPVSNAFYVNIADPAQIAVIDPTHPVGIARHFTIPVLGPHGLDIDTVERRLFCACDAGKLVTVDIRSGNVLSLTDISGAPDVIFYNPALHHLYVAVGEPGVIDVIDTHSMRCIETVPTEKGAHTLAFDARQNKVYAFLPHTHRAAVYTDQT